MKNLVTTIVLCLASVTGQAMAKEISGQVVVSAQGAKVGKQAPISVMLFDRKVLEACIASKNTDATFVRKHLKPLADQAKAESAAALKLYDTAFRAYVDAPRGESDKQKEAWEKTKKRRGETDEVREKICGRMDYPASGYYYFDDLPDAVRIVNTDAEGKFTFEVPEGSYAIAASLYNRTEDTSEAFYWMIKAPETGKPVKLSKDNLTSSNSPDSLIVTVKDEQGVYSAMNDLHGIRSLIELAKVEQVKHQKEEEAQKKEREDAEKAERESQLASFRQNPALAQAKAKELYPELAIAGSPLNTEFVARYKRYQKEKPEFFSEPDWPVRLAKEINDPETAK